MRALDMFQHVKGGINKIFIGKEPWQIVTITTSTVLIVIWCYDALYLHNESKDIYF